MVVLKILLRFAQFNNYPYTHELTKQTLQWLFGEDACLPYETQKTHVC